MDLSTSGTFGEIKARSLTPPILHLQENTGKF